MQIRKLLNFFLKESLPFDKIIYSKAVKAIPDSIFIKMYYYASRGHILHLKNPRLFNEKIQWLKLYDRNPTYTRLVDKYEVREYVAKMIGTDYLIPLLGGPWHSFSEIDFSKLPDRYVLKCTHDSGGVYINKDGKTDLKKTAHFFNMRLAHNYYYYTREWPYKNVPPRLIAEKYIQDESGYELKDYKIHVFNGKPRIIQVDFGRFTGNHRRNIYTDTWDYLPFSILYPTDPSTQIPKPSNLDEMLRIAKILAGNFSYVRIDLYVIYEKIFFGEMTFHHGSGFEPITPSEWNLTLGNWLVLPERQKNEC